MQLIETMLRDRLCTENELAHELVVTPRRLADYRAGRVPIPIERQQCLALYLIQLGSKYARFGYQLRDQLAAAKRYESRISEAPDHSLR
jgi:hypothetical protein